MNRDCRRGASGIMAIKIDSIRFEGVPIKNINVKHHRIMQYVKYFDENDLNYLQYAPLMSTYSTIERK